MRLGTFYTLNIQLLLNYFQAKLRTNLPGLVAPAGGFPCVEVIGCDE